MPGPVRARRHIYDGFNFASGLELYCYKALKRNNLFEGYENETFQLLDRFTFTNDCYEKQANGKGQFKNRGNKSVQGISYTPDFCSETFIIECKGRPNDSFPIRWKLFKQHLYDMGDDRLIFKPQSHDDIDHMIEILINY